MTNKSEALREQIKHAEEQVALFESDGGVAGSINRRQIELWQYELESLRRKLRIETRKGRRG